MFISISILDLLLL